MPVKVTGLPGYENFTGWITLDDPEWSFVVVSFEWEATQEWVVVPRTHMILL